MEEVDVVVVGAGAMGSATARALTSAGRSVAVLEQFPRGHDRGSSHGAARIVRLAYDDPFYVRLAQQAMRDWSEVEAECGRSLVNVTGGVDHGDPATLAQIESALTECAATVERLNADAATERWPGLRFDGEVISQPDAGRVDAGTAVSALQDLATSGGAAMRFECAVERVEVDTSGVVVHAEGASWRAPVAVVTAGAWVGELLGDMVALPPLRVTQEQPAFFAALDEATPWPSFIHHHRERPGHYGLASPGEGVKVGHHGTGVPVHPDRRDRAPDSRRLEELRAYVAEWLPGVDPEEVGVQTCLYMTTPDEDFLVDRVGPLVIGSPCSGHGFKFTPTLGRLLARLALGETAAPDRFQVGRFAP